jgi:hypothetical protein
MPGGDLWTAKGRGFEHCRRIYAALERRSVPVTGGEGAGGRLFRGSLQGLMVELGYTSSQQYDQVKRRLYAMGCVEQLRRGTARQPSLWLLKAAPSAEAWDAHVGRPFRRRVEQDHREAHAANLVAALERLPSTHPEIAVVLRDAGVRTVAGAVTWLASNLDEVSLRTLGPGLCLGYATAGTPVEVAHTCAVPDLDPLTPSTSAGAWKRRADKLAELGVP